MFLNADTSARMGDQGIICSTRVLRETEESAGGKPDSSDGK